jgi:hypothetical protein
LTADFYVKPNNTRGVLETENTYLCLATLKELIEEQEQADCTLEHVELESPPTDTEMNLSPSALLKAAADGHGGRRLRPGLCWVSGGQGVNWFDELQQLYRIQPKLRTFIELCAASVLEEAQSEEAKRLEFYALGFDLLSWLRSEDLHPSDDYLSRAPLSYPMIFLVQLCIPDSLSQPVSVTWGTDVALYSLHRT